MHEVAFSGPAVIQVWGPGRTTRGHRKALKFRTKPGGPLSRATGDSWSGGRGRGGDRPVEPDPQRPFEH